VQQKLYPVFKCQAAGGIKDKKQFGHTFIFSDETLNKVQQHFLQSPRSSIRKLCYQVGLSYRSTQSTTKHSSNASSN
jgi:hypothetical protein